MNNLPISFSLLERRQGLILNKGRKGDFRFKKCLESELRGLILVDSNLFWFLKFD